MQITKAEVQIRSVLIHTSHPPKLRDSEGPWRLSWICRGCDFQRQSGIHETFRKISRGTCKSWTACTCSEPYLPEERHIPSWLGYGYLTSEEPMWLHRQKQKAPNVTADLVPRVPSHTLDLKVCLWRALASLVSRDDPKVLHDEAHHCHSIHESGGRWHSGAS